jgi:transposase InsO family protein
MSNFAKDMEILALRSQLSITQQQILNGKISKPHFTPAFRQLWRFLSELLPNWQSALFLVKPETVIGWHRKSFKFFWTRKSRKPGRPKISTATIALIKRIHRENPLLSPEKIHERMVNLGITNAPAPNTIAKYIPKSPRSPSEKQIQSWKTFLHNHRKGILAMDFFVVPTLYFKILYVLVIISHDRRKIEHFAVTSNPSSAWVAQQIREATPYGSAPKYLVHDNDAIFISAYFQQFLKNTNIKSKKTGYHCPWQNGICERVGGILRRELLDYIIPLNERHLESLLSIYINRYYLQGLTKASNAEHLFRQLNGRLLL